MLKLKVNQFVTGGLFPDFLIINTSNLSFKVSGSGPVTIENKSGSYNDLLLVKSGSLDAFKINNDGVLILGMRNVLPTPVSGGMCFDQNGNLYIS